MLPGIMTSTYQILNNVTTTIIPYIHDFKKKKSKEPCSLKITNKKSNKATTMYCFKTEDYMQ